MYRIFIWPVLFLGVSLWQPAYGQIPTPTAQTLVEILTPSLAVPNEASLKLFPPSLSKYQTPLATRYTLVVTVTFHEITAACDPVVLSFFGTKDEISPELCSQEAFIVIFSYMNYRLLASEFPIEAREYGQFLISAGLSPLDTSTDASTRIGWANTIAARLVSYFSNDGWNSQGDRTKTHFRQRFENSVEYLPQNPAFLTPEKLVRPLRWQPLTVPLDGRGNFGSQVHIVPQIGFQVTPLTMSREELSRKQVDAPYAMKNNIGDVREEDKKVALQLIDSLFSISANLTTNGVFLSFYWEDKFFSLGTFAVYYTLLFQVNRKDATRIFLGDIMAQYDANILAWKEKLRHDLVRPPSLIRHLLTGETVQAYKGFGKGVGTVKAEEWEPVVPIQPHSEFPSASAVICSSAAETLSILLEEVSGNKTLPPFEATIQPFVVPNSPVDVPITVKFNSLDEAAKSCGNSRLLAGVHFAPAVSAGFDLATGVGKTVAEHVSALYRGEVPKNCARCHGM